MSKNTKTKREKTVTLTFKDRIVIPALLPKQGSFNDLVICEDIIGKVQVTQDELSKYEVKSQPNGQVTWNDKASEAEFDYTFSELEAKLISSTLVDLSNNEQLLTDHINMYRVFVS